eukprot:gene20418-24500_t
MSSLGYKRLRAKVVSCVGEDVIRAVESHADRNLDTKYLYGDKKGDARFSRYVSLLAIYKDVRGYGYDSLRKRISKSFHMSKESILHNVKAGRRSNYRWAKNHLKVPSVKTLNKDSKVIYLEQVPTADNHGRTKVNLWMDSTDVRMVGRRSMSKKHPNWSFKGNSPGRRFMMVTGGRGIIHKVWGPYSPKTYDGDFLKLRDDELSVVLRGCTVAADCHFEYGRTKDAIPGVTFLVPYPKKTKGKREVDGDHSAGLDDRHANYNRIVRSVRARVESPFGLMKRRFAALNGPFGEEEIQLKYLVNFASVVENMRRQ